MAKSIQLYNELEEKIFPFSLTTLIYDENGEVLEERLAIHGLTDVFLANLADGQSLVYDASKGVWINQKVASEYTLPLASSSTRGGVKIGFSATSSSGSYYNIPLLLASERAYVKLTSAIVTTVLGYTPMNPADFTGDNIIAKLGYTPFDKDDMPTNLSQFKNDLELGRFAYAPALAVSDIPDLGWSKIIKPTDGIPKTDLASAVQMSLGKADTALQAEDIYTLTIQKNGTTVGAYNPTSKSETINIADVASASLLSSHISNIGNPHSVTKAQVGLSDVENTKLSTWKGSSNISTVGTITSGEWKGSKILNLYLANNSMSIAGNDVALGGSLSASTLKSSLGLKDLAFKDSISFSDLSSHPTTLEGYGITDAYTKDVADKTFLKIGNSIQIGGATLSWDASAGMLKADKGFYSTGAITAGGEGDSNMGGPVVIDLSAIMGKSSMTDAQVVAAGLTEEVIVKLIAGKYTKVICNNNGADEVWNYSGRKNSSLTHLFFTKGDGFVYSEAISMYRGSDGKWKIIFSEI